MKNKKHFNLSTLYIIMIGVMLAQTIVSFFYNKFIFAVMLIFTVVILTVAIYRMMTMRSYFKRMYASINNSLEASSNLFTKMPMPVMVVSDKSEIVWYNDGFRLDLLKDEESYGMRLDSVISDKDRRKIKESGFAHVEYGEKVYRVMRSVISSDGFTQHIYFFIDETELIKTKEKYILSRPVVSAIAIDNLDELTKNCKDSERAAVSSAVENALENMAGVSKGMLRKLSSNRFMLITEERDLNEECENKFPILDQVRNIDLGAKGKATISIGVGHNCDSLQDCELIAYQALDMAQSRGGDQAAIKDNGNNYRFFGGVSKAVEKHTRVKARIVASAVKELIEGSEKVVIMGHRFADLDSFGSSVALWSLAKKMGKAAYVVMDTRLTMAGGLLGLTEKKFSEQIAYDADEVLPMIDKKTLLIVVDTHRPDFLDSRKIYDAASSVVVIDHHRKAVDFIDNAVIFYLETAASSASEMVAEMIQTINEQYIAPTEATALLSGIMLDTKNFVLHTGVRTFEASAFLRQRGADPIIAKQFLSGNMEAYRQKSTVTSKAEIYNRCAISINPVADDYTRIASSQAADEMLNISGVDASFVIYSIGDEVDISARSFGNINVQLIMEALGGGGHQTMAAAQLKDVDFAAAKQMLIGAIDENMRK